MMLQRRAILPTLLAILGMTHAVAASGFSGSEALPESATEGRSVERDVTVPRGDAPEPSTVDKHPLIHRRRTGKRLPADEPTGESDDHELDKRIRGGATEYIVAPMCSGKSSAQNVTFQISDQVWIKDDGHDWWGTGTIAGFTVCGTEVPLQVKTATDEAVQCRMRGVPYGSEPVVQFTSSQPFVKVLHGSGTFSVECDQVQ